MTAGDFAGAKCGCCGKVFGPEDRAAAVTHAGLICGPVLTLPDDRNPPNDGWPCPHGDAPYGRTSRTAPCP